MRSIKRCQAVFARGKNHELCKTLSIALSLNTARQNPETFYMHLFQQQTFYQVVKTSVNAYEGKQHQKASKKRGM